MFRNGWWVYEAATEAPIYGPYETQAQAEECARDCPSIVTRVVKVESQ